MRSWIRGIVLGTLSALGLGVTLGCESREHKEVRMEQRTDEGEVVEQGRGRQMVVE
ncbi:MAG: hypothetical protein LC135_08630 [Phycisphaerae bacterium]|jgi:hypothetical protein|nr:hypothetical protein [Phycisphaerae bacterium]MCZ2399916.1 hypothetical protein [Phycisphaerae bacterium]NUQ50085.1 hypothetical protein [Phycisphaerae bacterium]